MWVGRANGALSCTDVITAKTTQKKVCLGPAMDIRVTGRLFW